MNTAVLIVCLASLLIIQTSCQNLSVNCIPPLESRYRAVNSGEIRAECFGGGDPCPLTRWSKITTLYTYPRENISVSIESTEVSSELFVCTSLNPTGIEHCFMSAYFETHERLYSISLSYLNPDQNYNYSGRDYDSIQCVFSSKSEDFIARESEVLLSLLTVQKTWVTDESNLTNYIHIFYEFMCIIDQFGANFTKYNPFFGDNIYQSGLIISDFVSTIYTTEDDKYIELFTYLSASLIYLENYMNISNGQAERKELTECAVMAGIYTTPSTNPVTPFINKITDLIEFIINSNSSEIEEKIINTTKEFENFVDLIDQKMAQDNVLTDKIVLLVSQMLSALKSTNSSDSSNFPTSLLRTIQSLEIYIDKKIQGKESDTNQILIEDDIILISIIKINTSSMMQPLTLPNKTLIENQNSPIASIPVSVMEQVAMENNVLSFYISTISYDFDVFFADEAVTTRFLSLNFHLPQYSNFASTINITFSHDIGFIDDVTTAECIFFNNTDGLNNTGLKLLNYNEETIVCSTNHTTTFSAIVRFVRKPDRGEYLASKIVSFILIAFSFFAIFMSLLLFCLAGKTFFLNLPNLVYFNYAITLLFGCGTFLFLLPTAVLNRYFCVAAVFISQYAWISVFTWSLCVSIMLVYFSRIRKIHVRNIKPFTCYFIFGWGLPLIPCLITLLSTTPDYLQDYINYESMVENATCFLSNSLPHHTSWGLLGPVLILLFLNIILLTYLSIYLCWQMNICCGPKETREIDIKFKQNFRSLYIGFLSIILILGLPWIFLLVNVLCEYFIQVDLLSSIMEWLFLIINAPIGVVFFFAYTIKAKEVRNIFSRNIFTKNSNLRFKTSNTSPTHQSPPLPTSMPRPRKRLTIITSPSSSLTSDLSPTSGFYDNPMYSP
ncbi:hypothetical protein LOD99_3705 [Oopsacas minuta]|uniref:G-protein coupled receptors family 2 profile 2 domain-containing protein n=1 Tax=Oopsacas minuta TaxID=111878 RepID=A0AAV7JXJ2_9METZ|nr:hypothetical protein LOD99_3705 [Oopsacas minuta]